MTRLRAEPVTAALTYHGEGPVWDERTGRLLWVDLLAGDLLALDADGEVHRTHVASVLACVAPRAGGGFVAATERGFSLVDADGAIDALPDVWSDPAVRMNDGGCDPAGRFYCGSMAYDEAAGRGALYRLDPDRQVHEVFGDVTISNGLGWSPDGEHAYYVDTPTGRIDRGSADLADRRPWVQIAPGAGSPDGLTVDAEGGVWVALWGGSAVHRYTPSGELDVVVDVGVRQPSSCAFGGDELATLYITTSAEKLARPEPDAGAVFAVRPGVRGLPTSTFAG